MGRSLHIGAAVCGTISCILVIVALASSSWITGCIPYGNIFKVVRENPEAQKHMPPNYEQTEKLLEGTKFCIDLGVFKLKMKVANIADVSLNIDPMSLPRAVSFGVAALVMAVVMGAIGVILLLVAVAGDHDSYEGKGTAVKRTRAAMILLVLAGLAGVFGMAAYTGGTAQAASDPLMFLANIGLAAGSSFQNKLMGGQFANGRAKRDLMAGLQPEMKQYISTLTEGLHPSYGAAYFIGWASIVFMIIAVVLAAAARHGLISQPYSGPSSMKL